MKKQWIWLGVTAVAVAVALFGFSKPSSVVTVDAVTLAPVRVEQTVSCMGAVEAADGNGVFAPVSCFISRVNVRPGQRVKKGDVLAVADRETSRLQMTDATSLMALAAMSEQFTAPEDGIVVSVSALPGQILELGTPCAIIAYDRDIRVRIAIREKDLRVLEDGMSVRLTGDGFEKDVYAGTLTEIAAAARTDMGSGTVVEGVVTLGDGQVDPSLRLGLTAKAAVVTSVTESGLVVPYEAVLSDESGSYVYIADQGVARRYTLMDTVQVSGGVLLPDRSLEGSSIILQPDQVTDGQSVEVREAEL